MVASISCAAHRGAPNFLVTALVLGQSPMALAESPAQRQELIAAAAPARRAGAHRRGQRRAYPHHAGRALPLRLPEAVG